MQFSYMWIWLGHFALIYGYRPVETSYLHHFDQRLQRTCAPSTPLPAADENARARPCADQPQDQGEVHDVVSLMQRSGAQPGRVHGETAELLENVLRGKFIAVRSQHRGRARNLLWILRGYVRRGLNSRVEGVRQMARIYEYVREEFWPSVRDEVNEHSDRIATWVEDFWRTTRSKARNTRSGWQGKP